MENKPLYVFKYRERFVTVYKTFSTVSGIKFPTIEKAKKQIDKLILLTKNVIG